MVSRPNSVFTIRTDVSVDIYGDSKASMPSGNGQTNGKSAKKTRNVIQLSLCDALPAYGPITDMAFSLARNGVRPPTQCHASHSSNIC
jgi:cleavage and polyadenylation specificity factor subunit 1